MRPLGMMISGALGMTGGITASVLINSAPTALWLIILFLAAVTGNGAGAALLIDGINCAFSNLRHGLHWNETGI